jgi:MFS family permease
LPRLVWTSDLRKILFVVFLSGLASALIEPIYLIYLKHKFELSIELLALMFLPSGIVYAILPRYAGRWADRWGRAQLITIGVTLAGLVSMALPFWPNLYYIGASYILFAVGWAMASPAEDALVADLAPDKLRGAVIGAKEAAAGLGAALGPMLGGFIYEYWAKELAFVINGILLLITAGLVFYWFHNRALPSQIESEPLIK